MKTPSFRPVAGCALVSILSFTAGATLFAQAQTSEENVAIERAQSALRNGGIDPRGNGGRGYDGRIRPDAVVSPDGNFVVFDLGEGERYGQKTRSQAVYDFAAKKVYTVRFTPSQNDIGVNSEYLR